MEQINQKKIKAQKVLNEYNKKVNIKQQIQNLQELQSKLEN